MILNPNKTKTLVVSSSRTINPQKGNLIQSGVSICASSNLDILGVKFDSRLTFKNHVRGIVPCVSQIIGILRLVKHVFVDTSVLLRCYNAFVLPILEYCSPCGGLLLNVIFSFSGVRCIRRPGFAQIRLSCRCVIDVIFLHCVCCTRLIRTRIIDCSVSFHLLMSEFDIAELRLQLIKLEFEVSRCRTSQLPRCFLPAQIRLWNDLPYTVFHTGTLDGCKGAVNRWLLP